MTEQNGKTVPGIEATIAWLAAHNIKPYRFALDNKIDPAGFSRILKRGTGVSLETALKIERGTNGAVTADMFVEEERGSS